MSSPSADPKPLTFTQWLVILVAIIGFLFDTYELLMFPVIAGPAVAELLQVPPNNPLVTKWVGNMLWWTALCGGTFGLLGGWLTDRLGRKTVLAMSIGLYSFSPVLAALSTSVTWFLVFRCTTFVGVCVEFVAAITWLSELFPEKRRKEIVLGSTQAFASVGGLLVTAANIFTVKYAGELPALPIPEPFNAHASWRYTLMTGLLPAIPIALILPFVPESQVWLEKRRQGALKRPSILQLFTPEFRRVALITAILSACAYGAAFGALQLTPTRIAPGLAELAEPRRSLAPLREEATALNQQLNQLGPRFELATAQTPNLRELSGERAKTRLAMRGVRKGLDDSATPEDRKTQLRAQLGTLTNRFAQLESRLTEVTANQPQAKEVLLEREKILGQLGANREKQEPFDNQIKARGNQVQLWQELGGLAGRIALALLIVTAISRRVLLRLFLVPGLVVFPLTYLYLYTHQPAYFHWGVAAAGFLTVAQFSYFGEYLPKVFPLHLRATGGSFATNVGGRMVGTFGAFITANLLAPNMSGSNTFLQVAQGAAVMGLSVYLIALVASIWLPEPKEIERPI